MQAQRRILAEIKEYQKQIDINGKEGFNGYWIKFNEQEIVSFELLILGPENTPYESGWFYFTGTFPSNYPNSPPQMLFRTTNKGQIRFHPNLYQTGKVCLSILGTWSGQPWTSVMTLETVCISLRSILNENPITNEPGFEHESITSPRATRYICNTRFNTIKYALIEHWKGNTKLPESFQKIVNSNMYENIGYGGYYCNLVEFYKKEYDENPFSTSSVSNVAQLTNQYNCNWPVLLTELTNIVGDWMRKSDKMEMKAGDHSPKESESPDDDMDTND